MAVVGLVLAGFGPAPLKEAAANLGLVGCSHASRPRAPPVAEGRAPDLDPLMNVLFKTLQATQPRIVGATRAEAA